MEESFKCYAIRAKTIELLINALYSLQHGKDIGEIADTLIEQMQLAKAALDEVKDIGEVEAEEPTEGLPWE